MNNKKQLLVIAILFCSILSAHAQQLQKYPIAGTGLSYYGFCKIAFDISLSPDSSKVYAGTCKVDSVEYGVIAVQLHQKITGAEDAEAMAIAYADYLKTRFDITKSAGYGKGHTLQSRPDVKGFIDYWEDKNGHQWKIKCFTDGRYITLLFVTGAPDFNEQKANVFLDSIRYP